MTTKVHTVEEVLHQAIKFHRVGDLANAELGFRTILEVVPKHVEAMIGLGIVLCGQLKFHEALHWTDWALHLDRKNPLARSNRGMCLGQLKRFDEGLADLTLAAHQVPKNPAVWTNIGNMLIFMNRHKEAIEPLLKAIQLDPNHELAFYNIGIAYHRLGELAKAQAAHARAMVLSPNHHEARFNLGLCQLQAGNFKEGFRNYESRWDTADYAAYRKKFPQPKWLGDPADLTGKKVVVYGDQGLGDFLMFARYIPMIEERGADVHFAVHEPLRALIEENFPGRRTLLTMEEWPEIDYRIALPSCPLIFGTELNTIPKPFHFMTSSAKLAEWHDRMVDKHALKIGVCWSGNFKHINDEQRSIEFGVFRHLLDRAPPADWFSLVVDIRPVDQEAFDEHGKDVHQLPIRDYVDTIAVLRNLDLVITVDTSVAHAAATIGIPTWVLIPTPRIDWRWGPPGDRSPWYPSMHLFRQKTPGDWKSVLDEVRNALRSASQEAA